MPKITELQWSAGRDLPLRAESFSGKKFRIEDINVRISRADAFLELLLTELFAHKGKGESDATAMAKAILQRTSPHSFATMVRAAAQALSPHLAKPRDRDIATVRDFLERRRELYLDYKGGPDIGARPHPWTVELLTTLDGFGKMPVGIRTTAPTEWAQTLNTYFDLPPATRYIRPEIRDGQDRLFQSLWTAFPEIQAGRRDVVAVVHSLALFRFALETNIGTIVYISPDLAVERDRVGSALRKARDFASSGIHTPDIYLVTPDQSWAKQGEAKRRL